MVVGNSAGALAALQAAVAAPHLLRGLMLLDCSMRAMHEANQPGLVHPLISLAQWVMQHTPIGQWLVGAVLHQPGKLEDILKRWAGAGTWVSSCHLLPCRPPPPKYMI